MKRSVAFVMACVGVSSALLCGCSPSSTGVYAGLTEYRAEGGEFLLRYLAPPWQFKDDTMGSVVLEIPAPHVSEEGIDAALLPSKYSFTVILVDGTTARAQIDADVTAGLAGMEMILVEPRVVVTDSGDRGWEMLSERAGLNPRTFRRVTFDTPSGLVIHILVEASASLATVEMDRMIAAFDVLAGAS